MSELPDVEWVWITVLPENRPVYEVRVNGKRRLTVYASATGRSVRVFDICINEEAAFTEMVQLGQEIGVE